MYSRGCSPRSMRQFGQSFFLDHQIWIWLLSKDTLILYFSRSVLLNFGNFRMCELQLPEILRQFPRGENHWSRWPYHIFLWNSVVVCTENFIWLWLVSQDTCQNLEIHVKEIRWHSSNFLLIFVYNFFSKTGPHFLKHWWG